MRYLKVKKEAEQRKYFDKLFNYQDKWCENEAKLKQLLGCPIDNNLVTRTDVLAMENPPQQLRNQFKKPHDGIYEAKKNSAVNKQFMSLCKKLKLENYTTICFLADLKLIGTRNRPKKIFIPMFGDYYFSSEEGDWNDIDWVEEIDEPEFLRLRADWLESEGKAS